MSFALFYSSPDAQAIQASYTAARGALSAQDRQNVDAVWNAGLSTWNTTAIHAWVPATSTWDPACFRNGVLDNGLCDQDTRIIVVAGLWAANAAAYGAVRNAAIALAGFVGLWQRVAAADPDPARSGYMLAIAADMAATGKQPYP